MAFRRETAGGIRSGTVTNTGRNRALLELDQGGGGGGRFYDVS